MKPSASAKILQILHMKKYNTFPEFSVGENSIYSFDKNNKIYFLSDYKFKIIAPNWNIYHDKPKNYFEKSHVFPSFNLYNNFYIKKDSTNVISSI